MDSDWVSRQIFLGVGYVVALSSDKLSLIGPSCSFRDVGILDAEGYVTLMGHANDVIFYKKKPVFPVVIERKLSTYASVIGAQVRASFSIREGGMNPTAASF